MAPAEISPLPGRARQAIVSLWAALAASAIVAISDVASLPLLDDPTDIDALERFDSVTGLAAIAEFLALVLTAILFIRWFNAAHRGLDDLCPGVRRHDTW